MLSVFQFSILLSLIGNIVIGVFALVMNRFRQVNRYLFLATFTVDLWLCCLLAASFDSHPDVYLFWVRQSSVMSAAIPVVFDLLRIAIVSPNKDWRAMLKESLVAFSLFTGIVILCQTRFFVYDVVFEPGKMGTPLYGKGQYLFVAYWIVLLGLLIKRCVENMREMKGIAKTELQYMIFAYLAGAIVGISFAHLILLITGSAVTLPLTPLAAIVLDGIIAYGIVTRRLLGVGYWVRRLLAYAMMIGYLSLVYFAVWYLINIIMAMLSQTNITVNNLAATIIVALSLSPAKGSLQRFANKIFLYAHRMDENTVMQEGMQVLQSVTTLDDLLRQFSGWMVKTSGAERVYVFLAEGDRYVQQYLGEEHARLPAIGKESAVVHALERKHQPLARYAIDRIQPDKVFTEVGQWLAAADMDVVIGIYEQTDLSGMVMLGPRLSGRVYDVREQDVMQLLSNQLGVAVSNAKLYTKMQNHAIYDRALLDSLTSGVVGVNKDGVVTVFNKEARRITGLSSADIMGRAASDLPSALSAAILATRQNAAGLSNRDAAIERGGQRVPVRLSTSLFRDHTGGSFSTLLVFTDTTQVMKLEEQLRRTDRLSSIGVLSAGMAHEIKNPLVSIKTFAQLLPLRYQDGEFRETFSKLVDKEIDRIDQTVSRLLKFSRSAEPCMNPMHVHDFLEETLRLIAVQLKSRNISLVKTYGASADVIQGDIYLLNQAFVNFFLNAIEAMKGDGVLTVATSCMVPASSFLRRNGDDPAKPHIRIDINDTGCGISRENQFKIFDPFFTTKSEGTGMGLAVAHGILMEHRAIIDVTSEEGKGATFSIMLPLALEQEPET